MTTPAAQPTWRHVASQLAAALEAHAPDDPALGLYRSVEGRSARPGRPAYDNREIARRIAAAVRAGCSLGQIARALNEAGVPAPAGDRWWRSSVRRVADREQGYMSG